MQHQSDRKHTKAFTFMLSLGMLASVLIWAKLRLITDIPRSALAEPEEHELLPDLHYDDQASEHEGLIDENDEPVIQAEEPQNETIDTADPDESGSDSVLHEEPL